MKTTGRSCVPTQTTSHFLFHINFFFEFLDFKFVFVEFAYYKARDTEQHNGSTKKCST